jgi:hypothetical protein
MPSKSTVRKAKRDLTRGKSASTAAGEFVQEEMEHVRQHKHGARSSRQAIAIGLSKARRAGVPLKAPGEGRASSRTRKGAATKRTRGRSQAAKRATATRRR